MTEVKPTVNTENDTKYNKEMLAALGVARSCMSPDKELHIELRANGLAVIKSGMKCGVTNGNNMVLDVEFESIVVLQSGWMVACKHGVYEVYDNEGNIYKGLSFLKRENAIRFAKTL